MTSDPAGRGQFPCRIEATQPRLKRADVPVQIEHELSFRVIGRERSTGTHDDAADRHGPVLDFESTTADRGAKSAFQRDRHIEHLGLEWRHIQFHRHRTSRCGDLL